MDAAVKKFVESTPWAIAGTVQEHILRTLVNEAARFSELTPSATGVTTPGSTKSAPKLSIITPMYNTPVRLLQELIWSVQAQTWAKWELVLVDDCSPDGSHLPLADQAALGDPRIKVIRSEKNGGISGARNIGMAAASGDWTGFLDHDDLLHPQALGVFVRWMSTTPDANFLFSNEAKISEDSKRLDDFFYKPGFCRSTLLRSNYIAHLTFLREDLVAKSRLPDGRWFRAEFDGVEDHDFFLRASEAGGFKPGHIPLFLYYWRRIPNSTSDSLSAKPYVHERGLCLIQEYLTERGLEPVDVAPHLARGGNRFLRVRFLDRKAVAAAHVLVAIPFKDGWDLTRACLDSLEGQTDGGSGPVRLTCVLMDNASQNPATRRQLNEWLGQPRRHKYVVHDFPGAFNFARMNNEAVKIYGSSATHILHLNNDVELTDPATLATMISNLAYDPEIAFCGIRLNYPNGTSIQHGGIKFGLEMRGGPLFRTTHMAGYEDFAMDDHVATAVTFACAMSRKAVFDQLGALEESWMPNGLGDVDLGLRAIKAGYRNLYLGSVAGIHHESKTRKDFCEDLEQVILYERHAGLIQPQMLRQMGYDTFTGLQQGAAWFAKPLRYRIADRINQTLKGALGPFHRQLRNLWKQWESSQKTPGSRPA